MSRSTVVPEENPTKKPKVWTSKEVFQIYNMPFNDLLFWSHTVHRKNFEPNHIQLSKLLNIKTGGCPENCGYCNQSVHNKSKLKASKLINVDQVLKEAKNAKENGATRYCMGAAWREPKERDLSIIVDMIKGVKSLGLETCMTLGMLSFEQAQILSKAGLDYYNHNIDTSERFYPHVTTTHTFEDRLQTLENVRKSGIKVCCGGILGLGEMIDDRIDMLLTLANLSTPPESIPINLLIPIPGSKFEENKKVDPIEHVRIISVARILMPKSRLRLAAGRAMMSDELQALCFFSGANSIFVGDTLLTAKNPSYNKDTILFNRLGLIPDLSA
ncbi:biotin synthase BioB [Candidatus Liberibacter asiaticus]|uniref:Biotin synthase n=2 Tax=Liberibacter asiaticus TaxID=34021 RepID=C6XF06_LIBAP|nr:biotin synthase BioB [Candidatus Liberibacter asiaticus]ACT56958.1 biotin synthase [Candidatus Liberibacter asiaticus str. psy62]AGH16723.1 biotin synthase [Candidatus Liberibacter asiaticus str. gxpsy]ALK07098.1 biotin synthase BioB [Candidatus Liberibacter asiaticus]ASK52572.1 biotin synthase BioB [Candidatus Liberibacter asiaticus]AWL13898.1 biotin synthase BioB [Candidatus Liberibacter asiaticus]